ncbi:hypothetical protein D3C86_1822370 [compost metagenome]
MLAASSCSVPLNSASRVDNCSANALSASLLDLTSAATAAFVAASAALNSLSTTLIRCDNASSAVALVNCSLVICALISAFLASNSAVSCSTVLACASC